MRAPNCKGFAMKVQETSVEAWRSFLPVSAELDREIMAALHRSGGDGLICQEIEEEIDRLHQAVSGNLRHLVEQGLVKRPCMPARTQSGRRALTGVAADDYA